MPDDVVIFPQPRRMELGPTETSLGGDGRVTISLPEGGGDVADAAAARLSKRFGELGMETVPGEAADIALILDPKAVSFAERNQEDAYTIEVADGKARLTAAAPPGLLYAAVTVAALVRGGEGEARAPEGTVEDWPDLKFRGLFAKSRWGQDLMTLDDWCDAIDYLAEMKMNVLTIGIYNCWPIQYNGEPSEFLMVPLDSYPQLRRPQKIEYYSRQQSEWLELEYEAKMVEDDFFGEVVAYGQTRGVMVRPHFNAPGHNSFIPRMMPEISALDEDGDPTGYGFCLSSEKTYEVMFTIIDEICDKYLLPNGVRSYHIAADEVYPLVGMDPAHPYREIDPWCKCDECRQQTNQEHYVDFIIRIAEHLKSKGIEHISMWHDQLVRGGAMNQELARRFEEAGLTENIILHWWRYSDFFESTMPELGFRRWVTPMTGYFYQMPYRGHLDNIHLAEKLAVAEDAEGTESYGVFDKSFHRHFCALSEWSWNNADGGEIQEFQAKYARGLFGADWRQGMCAMRHFAGLVDNPVSVSLAASLFRYSYDYGQSYEQAMARDNYPQLLVNALWDAPPGMTPRHLGALRDAAQRTVEEFEKASWCDENLKWVYVIECKRIAAMAGAFLTALEIVGAYNRLRGGVSADEAVRSGEILADSSHTLVACLEEMDELILAIEEHREHYQQPHMIRELSLMRRFLTSLLGSINVIHEAIMSHKLRSLPDLEIMRVRGISWEG